MNVGSEYYGSYHRFCIRTCRDRDDKPYYMVHDASWITDDEMGEGRSSPTVAQFGTVKEAKEWCDLVEAGKIFSVPHEANFEGWPELERRVKWTTK